MEIQIALATIENLTDQCVGLGLFKTRKDVLQLDLAVSTIGAFLRASENFPAPSQIKTDGLPIADSAPQGNP